MHAAIADHSDWPRRRARLAVDLHFTTSKKQPPNLENLAKHYLDQLGETHDKGEGSHLYRDDRQVQLLHVSADHGWDPDGPRFKPGIFVTARTASEAAADMAEAGQLRDPDHRYGVDDLKWDEIREQLRDSDRVAKSTNPELRRAAPLMRFMALRNAQESTLHANDRWIERLFWDSAPHLVTGREVTLDAGSPALGERFRQIAEANHLLAKRILLGRDPGSIALPPLPAAPGEGERFRRGVRDAVRQYADANPVLFPLLVPSRLTVFVLQPEQPRDLDNILLDLLPVVDEIMKPPQEPWLLSAMESVDEIHDEDPLAEWERSGLRRLRSVVEHGVWSCQVVELKKLASDPPEGALGMILGHGENMRSLWAEAAARLEKRDDERDHTDDW